MLERGNRQAQKIFRAVTTLCDIGMMGISHYTFIQTHSMYNITLNPKVKYGFWMIMTCQCGLILGKMCTILLSDD